MRDRTQPVGLLDLALTGGAVADDDFRRFKQIDPDQLPDGELPTHPVVRAGDVWLLGQHRVACGDSTDPETVRRALGGAKPILMVTDPPYGVDYDPRWRERAGVNIVTAAAGTVLNDDQSDWRRAWALFPGDVAYIWHAGLHSRSVVESIEASGFAIRSQIIWVKSQMIIGRGDYHYQHEPCWYAVRKGKVGNWQGDRSQTTTWFIKHMRSETGHGTQKPVECMRRPILNNTARGDCVYEPFLGSGTTMIAAELEGRSCVAIELNPLYVYISINRWQHCTGQQATLDGETFTEVMLRRKDEPEQQESAHSPGPSSNGQDTGIAELQVGVNPEMRVQLPPASITFAPRPVTLSPTGAAQRANGVAAALTAPPPLHAPSAPVVAGVRGSRSAPHVFTAPRRVQHDDPFLLANSRQLIAAGKGRMLFDAAEWDYTANTAVGLDVEVYPNFFLVCFKRFSDGRRLAHEMSERAELDIDAVRRVMENTTVSFNGLNYDLPVLHAALEGDNCARLYDLSQSIIKHNERPQRASYGWNHVDLFEVNPSIRMGLKLLHGRLHGRWIIDLPYPPEEPLTPEKMNVVTLYCMNDLDATEGLRDALLGPLELRAALGTTYKLDLRSKSDAQVGEAIVRAKLGRVGKTEIEDQTFGYSPPGYLKFRGEELRGILTRLANASFSADMRGTITPPNWMGDLKVTIGETIYSMGIGGLHSNEANRALLAGDDILLDVDAASQYPLIIAGLGLHPPAAGPEFTRVYGELVKERLAAKAAGDRVRSDGLKIAANGTFGKMGSSYSFLYAPNMLLATTLTGQLSLLMLAEAAEDAGVPVVSANTDGLVFHCPRHREHALDAALSEWEDAVGMTLERTRYSALYSSSVNAYIAIKEDGKDKRRGWFANPWAENDLREMMKKNPQMTVIGDAVVAYLTQGVPLAQTIDACQDPRRFITVVRAQGKDGASWRGTKLGRVVRYYWSVDGEQIVYTDSGRRVAKTEGARPLMELTDRVPADLDRARYFIAAEELLVDLGVNRSGLGV